MFSLPVVFSPCIPFKLFLVLSTTFCSLVFLMLYLCSICFDRRLSDLKMVGDFWAQGLWLSGPKEVLAIGYVVMPLVV